MARQASQALTGLVRFLGSPEAVTSDLLPCDLDEEGAGSWAGVDGPADATEASVSAAAIIADEAMVKKSAER